MIQAFVKLNEEKGTFTIRTSDYDKYVEKRIGKIEGSKFNLEMKHWECPVFSESKKLNTETQEWEARNQYRAVVEKSFLCPENPEYCKVVLV